MKCIYGECKQRDICFEVDDAHAIVPFDCEISSLRQLFSYFLYRAPNVDSLKSPYLSPDYHEKVLDQILRGNENYHFRAQNSNTEKELRNVALHGTQVCAVCKRFFCKRMTRPTKRDDSRPETNLECLLRHLRNSTDTMKNYTKEDDSVSIRTSRKNTYKYEFYDGEITSDYVFALNYNEYLEYVVGKPWDSACLHNAAGSLNSSWWLRNSTYREDIDYAYASSPDYHGYRGFTNQENPYYNTDFTYGEIISGYRPAIWVDTSLIE